MDTKQLLEKMKANLERSVRFYMSMRGYTYEQAKAYLQDRSVAGPKVWAELDKQFKK